MYIDFLGKLGIIGVDKPMFTAGGAEPSKLFRVEALEIIGTSKFAFPYPVETTLFCFGAPNQTSPLIGLQLLNKWIAEFDGPRKHLKLLTEIAAPSSP